MWCRPRKARGRGLPGTPPIAWCGRGMGPAAAETAGSGMKTGDKSRGGRFYGIYLKRLFDIAFSIIFLPVLALVLVPLALAIKLEDGGRVFYLSNRIGLGGRIFKM